MSGVAQAGMWIILGIGGFFLPMALGGSSAVYSALVVIAIFAVMAYGLDIIVSDLGEVSLAHTVFFAIGAYTTAMTTSRLGANPLVSLAATIVLTLVVAGAIALATLRLRQFVFSLVTYAVTVVAMTIASNWTFIGGSDGISGIPVFSLPGFTARNDRDLWPVAWMLLLVALWFVSSFRRSRLGHAAMTVHLNPALATMSGINPAAVRMQVFLFSAPITASAGWLYAYQRAYISADVLAIYFLILILTAVVLIGRRVLLAPLAGVALIILQERFLSYGAYVDRIILGTVLILVLSFLPGGLLGLFRSGFRVLKPNSAKQVQAIADSKNTRST
ncbi:branched-chain amino acid ABC transporter permease [Paracoccus sediminicola]|uniref:branched-chain amino acid ABC transporter permease n=1 Tax=Paracoccus sediminicola TaxID=3017783 RepID=UPI0022F105F6|nr:branched-chain amino acid ABC transporter permease [Paracoccus sediminicola]WBU56214.1 branched-chain amino acid ABC transporter permease [Paracoccus sediminicola]